jgi:uncharacterized protein
MSVSSTHQFVKPSSIRRLDGFLGDRFRANIKGRIKDVAMTEEFIRRYEQQNWRDWFWVGEQIGKWLDSAAYSSLITGDAGLRAQIDEILTRLAKSQESSGYLGITVKYNRTPVRGMELYEWYYVLHGLLVCADLLGSQTALDIARKLGDYIIKTWGVESGQFPLAGRFPGNGHDGGEGTLILEPIVRLGMLSGDSRFIEWGEACVSMWDEWFERYPESHHTCGLTPMKRFAAGELEVDGLRENIHAHTFHMTLLGLAALYNATGKAEYRDTVLGSINRLADDWIFITGGMSTGERYVARRFYHPVGEIEVCPQHTWILLLAQAYEWTGEARYLEEIERDTFNQLLAAQLADGTNWSYMTPLNGHAQEPTHPNCCNASGQRILGQIPTYLYGLRSGCPAVLLYSSSSVVIEAPTLPPVTLTQVTDFPSSGDVTITVNPASPARFALHLRVPSYATGAVASVDGKQYSTVIEGYLTIERDWQAGDVVSLHLPMPIRAQASAREVAIVRGPLVYAYFQNGQPTNEPFHWHKLRYPAEVELRVDPTHLSPTENAAPEGLLGPALVVNAEVLPPTPMFNGSKHNGGEAQPQTVTLLPFANQGKLRGEYQVFMRYR